MVNFNFISTFVWQQKSKKPVFWPNINNLKFYLFVDDFLSICIYSIYSISQGHNLVFSFCVFSLPIIAGRSSAAGLAYLNLTLCARKEFWVIYSYRGRRMFPIPISEIFWATQSYQRIVVHPLFCLQVKTSPKCPW